MIMGVGNGRFTTQVKVNPARMNEIISIHTHQTWRIINHCRVCYAKLSLVIVIPLTLHSKNLRDAMGPLSKNRTDFMYRTVITILVDLLSFALSACRIMHGAGRNDSLWDVIFPLLSQAQVRAIFAGF